MIIKDQLPQPNQQNQPQPEPVRLAENGQNNITVSYNWIELKEEFMQGPWVRISEFKKDQHMPLDDQSLDRKMKGWAKKKKYIVKDLTTEFAGEVVDITDNSPAAIELTRREQAKTARILQKKGLDALDVFSPKNAEEARKMVVSGLQEERAALGISERGGQSNLTQVNVSLPKTKFDKIINEQDFAGILKFIAEIKRERTRRVGGFTPGSGKAATR